MAYTYKAKRLSRTKVRESKPIACYDKQGNLIQEFPSIKSVSKYNYQYRHVVECLKGIRKTHRKLIWKFLPKDRPTKFRLIV